METLNWSLKDYVRYPTLTFLDPTIESLYSSLRSNRVLTIFPKVLLIIVCASIIFRRTQLLVLSASEETTSEFSDELRIFCISMSALLLELTTNLFDSLAKLRCVPFVLLSFYTAIDGSLTYYQSRVQDEPVFAYGSFQFAGVTLLISVLLCHSWIGSFLSHLIGQCIVLYYIFTEYDLTYGNKLYMCVVAFVLGTAYCFSFFSIEYVIRCGVLQYYRKNQETKNWKEMMDNLSKGILIQRENQIIYTNTSLRTLLNVETNDEIHDSLKNIPASSGTSLANLLEKGKSLNENSQILDCIQYRDPSSKDKRLSVEVRKTHFDGKVSVAFGLEDLTATMELERQELNKKFEKMLFASFTHEIVTPVNGIIGLMEIMQSEPISEEMNKLVETSKQTCKLLLYLVKDIAGFSQQQNTIKPSKDWFSIKEVIEECEQLYIFSFKQKQLMLINEIGTGVPGRMVYADRVKYRQVIIQLLGNALKYTIEGSVTIRLEYHPDSGMLITSIIDTGIGMSQSETERLFQLFGNFSGVCELNPQGVGLGLYICQRYTAILEGTLSVKSGLGKGSIFTLTIPVEIEPLPLSLDSNISEDSKEPCLTNEDVKESVLCRAPYTFIDPYKGSRLSFISKWPQKFGSMQFNKCNCRRFLIVDDNDLNRFAMQGLLRRLNESGDETINGQQAVEKVLERSSKICCRRYQMVFMDINMPVMDGVTATRILKQKMKIGEVEYMPVVAVSAARCDNEEDKQKYLEVGFDDFSNIVDGNDNNNSRKAVHSKQIIRNIWQVPYKLNSIYSYVY